MGTRFREVSGIYIVANRFHGSGGGYRHSVLDVGSTEDLSQPFPENHNVDDCVKYGANGICLRSDDSEDSRAEEQSDRVAAFHPACHTEA